MSTAVCQETDKGGNQCTWKVHQGQRRRPQKITAPNCAVIQITSEGQLCLPSRWLAIGQKKCAAYHNRYAKVVLLLPAHQACHPQFHDWKSCPKNTTVTAWPFSTLNIDKIVERFERDLHIRSVFAGREDLIPPANPKIYIRSKWKPREWDILLELKWRHWIFRKALEPKFRFRLISHNLLPHQRRTIGFITKKPHFMVVQRGKRLGLGVINPKEYFQFSIKDHLRDAQTYQRLSPAEAEYRATLVQKLLEKWIKSYLDVLNKKEINFFRTNIRSNDDPRSFFISFSKCEKWR